MIWDFIRDFFVQYIFGGYSSTGDNYSCLIGEIYSLTDDDNVMLYSDGQYYFNLGKDIYGANFSITLGDWLSTTMTIICMVLISICFILLVRWLFKAVASAFLLK